MALSTTHTGIDYLVGRLLACAYPDSSTDMPSDLWETAHTHPVKAIGLMADQLAHAPYQDNIAEIMAAVPADARDEPRGRKIEDQGGVALGYYHQRAAMRRAKAMTGELLRQIGEAIYGERWQSDMRDALGLTDATRIRDWLSGRRRIPAGVVTDLLNLARERAGAAAEAAQQIEVLMRG